MARRKKKVAYKITGAIMAVQAAVFIVMFIFVSNAITRNIRENTISSMQTVVDDRSQIIENYVREVENYLTAYSRSGEIEDILILRTWRESMSANGIHMCWHIRMLR